MLVLTLQHLLKMEPIQYSETSVFTTQTPRKYPENNLSLLLHGESLKSRINNNNYVIGRCKSKFVLDHTVKEYRGVELTPPYFLKLRT